MFVCMSRFVTSDVTISAYHYQARVCCLFVMLCYIRCQAYILELDEGICPNLSERTFSSEDCFLSGPFPWRLFPWGLFPERTSSMGPFPRKLRQIRVYSPNFTEFLAESAQIRGVNPRFHPCRLQKYI